MTFRPDANLDPGQVSDRRGRRVSGGGLAMGGGIGGLAAALALSRRGFRVVVLEQGAAAGVLSVRDVMSVFLPERVHRQEA